MTDKEHLEWIYQRLVKVHGESELMDYMHRLKKIIGRVEQQRIEVLQLKTLLDRIHHATKQFEKRRQSKKPDNCPYDEILGKYHWLMSFHPKVRKLTNKRKVTMRKRWLEDLTSIEDWEAYFKDAARKPFLTGKNDRGWVADFDFLLREDVIAKMQEGKYD